MSTINTTVDEIDIENETDEQAKARVYRRPDMLTEAETAAAAAAFSAMGGSEQAFDLRMARWRQLRVGFMWSSGASHPDAQMNQADAIAWVVENLPCLHTFAQVGHWDTKSGVSYERLGTYRAGIIRRCTTCGLEDRLTTVDQNYSGD